MTLRGVFCGEEQLRCVSVCGDGESFNLLAFARAPETRNGRKHRRGLDTLNEIKFVYPTVVNGVKEIFGSGEYKKVLVVWDIQDSSVIKKAKSIYNIDVWKISNVISELMREVKSRPYRDDVLRTIQLISKKANSVS